MERCWLCDIRPIDMELKPLCHSCYSLCRKKRVLHIFPTVNSENKTIIKAIDKYGDGFRDDMDLLRSGGTTLAKVGNKYGLTRERIRQVYPKFFGEKYTEVTHCRKVANKVKKEKLYEEKMRFDNRLNRAKKNCPTYTGIVAENLFRNKCESLGYKVKMMNGNHLYDAEVNGIPVDIKSNTESAIFVKCKSRQKYYHFNTTDKQKGAVKFFPVFLFDENSWYILPVGLLNKIKTYYIPKYDIEYAGSHKYRDIQKYREAWHLLKG